MPAAAAAAADSTTATTKSSRGRRRKKTATTTTTTTTTGGLLDYLQSLPTAARQALITDAHRGRFVAAAIVQHLSAVTQQVVLRLVCSSTTAYACREVPQWCKTASAYPHVVAELEQWHLLDQDIDSDEGNVVKLNDAFHNAIQQSLCYLQSAPWTPLSAADVRALEAAENAPRQDVTLMDLETYTTSQWDAVLHFLVGSSTFREPPPAVVQFLLQTGLMQPDPDDHEHDADHAALVITQKGYDFMLQDGPAQVWHFILQYLQSLSSHERGPKLLKEALLLLISLSFCHVGQCFETSSLTKSGKVLVKDLALFGLIYTRSVGNKMLFYPTQVALQLVSNGGGAATRTRRHRTGAPSRTTAAAAWALSTATLDAALAHPRPHDSSHLAIIVQTNFQVCAYTTSELHVSMLGLFCDVNTIRRLPNLCVMMLSRDAVKNAFSLGIQAAQIIAFLEKHAHPKLRASGVNNSNSLASSSPVPANVRDQLWLWDRERHRLSWTHVYAHPCLMTGEFAAVQAFATSQNALAFASARKQQLLLDYEQVDTMETFVRSWRSEKAKNG